MRRRILRRALPALGMGLAGAAAAEPWRLEAPGGELHGTLLLPAGEGRVPGALLLAGSGPSGRDGDAPQMRHAALRRLAEDLAVQGIATLRVDKRGVGESTAAAPDEAALRPETYARDAGLWLARFAAHPRVGAVAVIGHSEGGLIGALLAQPPAPDAMRGLVLLAAPGRRLGVILREQLTPLLPADTLPVALGILARLEAGESVAEVPPVLAPLFRPSVQPYLRAALALDPPELLARVQLPVLIVQGGRDIQVRQADAHALAGALPAAQSLFLPHMNHVLRDAPADPAGQLALYNDAAAPLAHGLIPAIAAFLRGLS
ncbi:alpha/beta hydrolase [Roseococcus suduntuyensis]|uniref:Serine aminopeptidase S33 domain-containing protein n=1 Tax=Roseococcus suduntuyensis TaxID=455361 RepID=A0A840ABM7_9PROT|nr:alpha/beta fold hydrolase [Roseococcus suduntuyensis]MBB3897926.1 hypothetical protein [Roseococcus suduntuyensis]